MKRRLFYIAPVLIVLTSIGANFISNMPAHAAGSVTGVHLYNINWKTWDAKTACANVAQKAGNSGDNGAGWVSGETTSTCVTKYNAALNYCKGANYTGVNLTGCIIGYYTNTGSTSSSDSYCVAGDPNAGSDGNSCEDGAQAVYGASQNTNPTGVNQAPSADATYCTTKTGQSSGTDYNGCITGLGHVNGANLDPSASEYSVCTGLQGSALTYCQDAYISVVCVDSSGKALTGTDLTTCKNNQITSSPDTGSGGSSSSSGDPTSDCIANGSTTLEWLFCPLTTAIGHAVDAINGFIENQLDFNTSTFLPNGGTSSGAGVHVAWNIIKDLVSSVLIILLLIMVISQALGSGLFEAYTVKKVLPRLVIAVIAMQVSWDLCKFLINIADDLGNGLKDLITAPFGGAGNLDLNSLLSHLGAAWAGGANVGIAAALVTSGFLAIGNPAGAMLIAFGLIAAVLIALATILFRNVLIIALVILSPLAILLWVLPGGASQNYWKQWRENFTKLLLLFPLMVGIIYTGRIFAYIVGGQGNAGFIDFIMVLVGFFGPYFIIPKAFKWGGSLMTTASNAANTGGAFLSKKPKEALQQARQDTSAQRRAESGQRWAQGRPSVLKGDYFRAGYLNPALTGRNRVIHQRRLAKLQAEGATLETEEARQHAEEVKSADSRADLVFEQTDDHDGVAQAMAVGNLGFQFETHADRAHNVANGLTGTARRMSTLGQVMQTENLSLAQRQAGLNAVAKYGGGDNMRFLDRTVGDLRSTGSGEERAMAKRFIDTNAQALGTKMRHLLYGADRDAAIDSMVGSMSESSFAGMDGAEAEGVIESLTQRSAAGSAPGATAAQVAAGTRATERLSRFLNFYNAAIDNETIRPNITSGVNQAVEAFVTGPKPAGARDGNFERINRGRATPINGVTPGPGINDAAAANPAVSPRVAALSGRIDTDGRIT